MTDGGDCKIPIAFFSKSVGITWFLITMRQEVKNIDNVVLVHKLELAIKCDLYGLL